MTHPQNILSLLRQLAVLEAAGSGLTGKKSGHAQNLREMESIRGRLPTAILKHYDQRRARGKPGIAAVRNGVCGACHLSLPRGRAAELRHDSAALSVCDNCGVFVFQEQADD